ncbi:MAG: ribonuclease transrane protein [Pseudomonadota bacterium]|jgi:membrane protein
MSPYPTHPSGDWSRVQLRDLMRFALRRLKEERLPEVAASLTFTTALALVPVLTIAFAIFTTFPLFTTFRDSLDAYFVQILMPKGISNTILDYLSQFAAKASRLSVFGAVFLIVTAIMMFGTVDRTLNQIWRVKTSRPFLQRMIIYWAIMTLGPLLLGASLSFASELSPITGLLGREAPFLRTLLLVLVSLSLSTLAFSLLYLTVPNRVVDWRDAAIGGLVAATAFEITRRLFTFFIVQGPSSSYKVVYGALAAVPIFLIWVYLFWLITLAGAVIAAALPVVKYERWWHKPAPGSEFLDAMNVLKVMVEARSTTAAVDALRLREFTRLGFEESESLLQRMLDVGWVGRVKSEVTTSWRLSRKHRKQDRWVLLANPEKLTVSDVYQLFAFVPSAQSPLSYKVEQAVERELATPLKNYFNEPLANSNNASST